MTSDFIAHLNGVTRQYQFGDTLITALDNIDLSIRRGSFTFITGPSGSGKTTALNMLGAIDTPSMGNVNIINTNLSDLNDNQLTDFRSRHIAYIFQNFNLIPVLDVFENVEYPLLLNGVAKKERKRSVEKVLAAVGLGDRCHHRPNELSGGQRQRVAIARALVKQPTIVLADEPTANLDSQTGEEITELMRQMQREFNTTFIFSSHDRDLIALADQVFHIKDGKLTQQTQEAAA